MTEQIFETQPRPPKSTDYSRGFEDCWAVHRVGNKKSAWKAGEKAGFDESQWLWLQNYLERRWKEDVLWVKGARDPKTGEVKKYIPHLSSIINQERWDDPYEKVKIVLDRHDHANKQNPMRPMTAEERQRADIAGAKALEELRGIFH